MAYTESMEFELRCNTMFGRYIVPIEFDDGPATCTLANCFAVSVPTNIRELKPVSEELDLRNHCDAIKRAKIGNTPQVYWF